jgi:hypothetical protein
LFSDYKSGEVAYAEKVEPPTDPEAQAQTAEKVKAIFERREEANESQAHSEGGPQQPTA